MSSAHLLSDSPFINSIEMSSNSQFTPQKWAQVKPDKDNLNNVDIWAQAQ